MKTFNIFDEYFKAQGINTRYNTLGYTSQMVVSYVDETRDIVGKKQSNISKSRCYNQYYDMKERPKYTGFEWAKEEDYEIREKLYKVVDKDQTREQYFLDGAASESDYLTLLKESLPHGNNLLYLSGGVDSEMVALTMIDTDVKFTPIILQYTKNGRVMNDFDTMYATKFCNKHKLEPYYYSIDVLKLWNTTEFIDLAIELGSVSPQQGLYAHAVHEIDKIFPDSLHMFGGEIRYLTEVEAEDNKLADLVMMVKTTPGYNGLSYSTPHAGSGSKAHSLLYTAAGTWRFPTSPASGIPITGNYTNTPAANRYEIQATCTAHNWNGATTTATPALNITSAWATVTATDQQMCLFSIVGTITGSGGNATFTTRCRSVLNPSTVVTATITLAFTQSLGGDV